MDRGIKVKEWKGKERKRKENKWRKSEREKGKESNADREFIHLTGNRWADTGCVDGALIRLDASRISRRARQDGSVQESGQGIDKEDEPALNGENEHR
jgi:hypothetical protein